MPFPSPFAYPSPHSILFLSSAGLPIPTSASQIHTEQDKCILAQITSPYMWLTWRPITVLGIQIFELCGKELQPVRVIEFLAFSSLGSSTALVCRMFGYSFGKERSGIVALLSRCGSLV